MSAIPLFTFKDAASRNGPLDLSRRCIFAHVGGFAREHLGAQCVLHVVEAACAAWRDFRDAHDVPAQAALGGRGGVV